MQVTFIISSTNVSSTYPLIISKGGGRGEEEEGVSSHFSASRNRIVGGLHWNIWSFLALKFL